jgi:hypothetical protein
MSCSLNTVGTCDWIGNRLLRSDGCYDTLDDAKYEQTTEGSTDREHASHTSLDSHGEKNA